MGLTVRKMEQVLIRVLRDADYMIRPVDMNVQSTIGLPKSTEQPQLYSISINPLSHLSRHRNKFYHKFRYNNTMLVRQQQLLLLWIGPYKQIRPMGISHRIIFQPSDFPSDKPPSSVAVNNTTCLRWRA
jgi:hypothetical protein